MCRNIRTLFNFEPPATDDECRDAAVQYVRKISGTRKPSKANQPAFDQAIDDLFRVTRRLVDQLETTAPPRDREEERRKAQERAKKRFARP